MAIRAARQRVDLRNFLSLGFISLAQNSTLAHEQLTDLLANKSKSLQENIYLKL